ncbi:MAG: hypothetical protein Ta2B_07730 [Termitinemataceae bacterium]|nr:MAG: hypothetical protein Ta2B_07730 [Termitinemataceae bacterium]
MSVQGAIFVFVLSLLLVLSSCKQAMNPQTELVMGTICSINLYEGGSSDVYNKIFSRLKDIEEIFSANKEGTVLDALNKNAGIKPVLVPTELIFVLNAACQFALISDGAFNPAIGPLVKLWDIGSGEETVPNEEQIKKVLPLLDWSDIEINNDAQTVFLKKAGMQLDLGGIVKGYAADEIVEIVNSANKTQARGTARIKKVLIDLGGNIYVYGKKKGNWKIGLQDPNKARGAYLGYVEAVSGTLVTSGIYERFFESNGKRYHHILSSATGYPVENDLASVTIINKNTSRRAALYFCSPEELHSGFNTLSPAAEPRTRNAPCAEGINPYGSNKLSASVNPSISMNADALSTTVFSLGYEKGSKLLTNFNNIDAVFIFKDGTIKTFGDSVLKQLGERSNF